MLLIIEVSLWEMGEVTQGPVYHGPSSAAVCFPSASVLLAQNDASFTSAWCWVGLCFLGPAGSFPGYALQAISETPGAAPQD